MNNAIGSICIDVFVWMYVFVSLEYLPGVELLGHVVILCFTFPRLYLFNPNLCIPPELHHFTFPPRCLGWGWASDFSGSLPTFVCCQCFLL